ncbi:MAG: hypothetical protein KF795_04785 [Labilithrix sp.]|nr:hypothetical protein [Labilithrix sp.]
MSGSTSVSRGARRALVRLGACALVAFAIARPTLAHAQDMGVGGASPGGATSGPSWGRPDVTNSPESGHAPKESHRSVKLFDTRKSIVSLQLDVGPIWARRVQDETPITQRRNFERGAPLAGEIGFGTVYTTPSPRGPFFMVGHLKTLLRVIDDKSFSWSIFHQELGGGLMLGPFEPEVRLRLSVLTADIMHAQPSIQLLSPGVSAGFGIHVGKIRLDIKAHSEYLWRWFGPDYLIRGVTIGFRLDQSRPKTPYPGAPSPQ